MTFYSYVLNKIILPIGDFITGSNVMKDLREFRKVISMSETDIEIYTKNRLFQLLDYTTSNINYYKTYRQYLDEDPYTWIKQFPIMKKKEIKANIDSLLSKPRSQLILSSSSGSTGEHGIVYKDKQDISKGRSRAMLTWGWAGFYPGKSVLMTGMTAKRGLIKSLKDFFFRTNYYIAFGLSDIEVEKLLEKQKGKKGLFLAGYASSIYLLADVCIRKNISDVKFDGAISYGDKLFPHYRQRIKEAFGCNVIDTYGLSEGLLIAAQKDLDYYYIFTPHVYLELLDEKGNDVEDGQIGHVVATSLDAYSMPLIRYYTGDLAIKLPRDRYPLNREFQLPLLEKVIGRDTDIVKTASGKYMIVHFFTGIFEHVSEIKQFKVVQKGLDKMTIEYIEGENFDFKVCKKIENIVHNYLNEPFPIEWIKVEKILPTPSGKPQIIQSFLSH